MSLPRFLLPLVLPVVLAAAPQAGEAAVRQLVQQYLEARDRDDAASLRKLFVPEVDQLVSSGEWRRGREAVVSGTLASSKRTGGQRAIRVDTVRFVTSDTALAEGSYELSGLAGGETRHMWSTFVLVRTPEGWRIAAIRNMLPAPAVPAR